MKRAFRWNEWNLEHVTKHGITPAEVEMVVRSTTTARRIGNEKYEVIGRGRAAVSSG